MSAARVIIRRDPGGYREPAYWHAECRACMDAEVDCYPTPGGPDEQSASETFLPVLAYATNHALNCPAILVERLQEVSGYRWCRACNRITSPLSDCGCGWWG